MKVLYTNFKVIHFSSLYNLVGMRSSKIKAKDRKRMIVETNKSENVGHNVSSNDSYWRFIPLGKSYSLALHWFILLS